LTLRIINARAGRIWFVNQMDWALFSLQMGWLGMSGGAVSGAVIGLYFHRDGWLGGYGSFPRRMVRLGHISFFGLGFLNVIYGLTAAQLRLAGVAVAVSAIGFAGAALAMPACCFLSAVRPAMRHLFPVPVAGIAVGLLALLTQWWSS
jgi:hypothetical protein